MPITEFSHGGKFGDLIYSLPNIKTMGGGSLTLYPNAGTGMVFTPDLVEVIRPLLANQPYIETVRYASKPSGFNLDTFRNHWRGGYNISDIMAAWLGLAYASRTEPWLTVTPLKEARVVFSRCPRYQNGDFPWGRVVAKYGMEAVFLGHRDEHADFCSRFGSVAHLPTGDLFDAARIIAGCELFVGNQSALRAIAEGLKKPVVQETDPANDNCHWERPNAWYGYRSDVFLPDLGAIPTSDLPATGGGSYYVSETSRARPLLAKFCEGYGLDLGFGGDPITASAIRVDMPQPYAATGAYSVQLGGAAEKLNWFTNEVFDYVYSSHLLEDYHDTETVLREWLRVLRQGGRLVLFLPDEQRYREHCHKTGQPYNHNHVHNDFSSELVKRVLGKIGGVDVVYETGIVHEYSFGIVAQKVTR